MATGYHICLGYNSTGNPEDKWRKLRGMACNLRFRPDVICDEIRRIRGRDATKLERECAESFADDRQCAFTLIEEERDGEPYRSINLMASAGNPGRTAKEETRRAFCRCVMTEMHSRGIEVSITVS